MKKQLTDRQDDILRFIHHFRNENGYPPTLREIGKKFEIASTFGVKRHLDALEKKGYLNVESNASRGISLQPFENDAIIDTTNNFTKIPIIGHVAAGIPITAIENIDGSLVIDSSFMKHSESCFALRVKGDSMINAGIFEGDLVVVLPKKDAANGETIVAMLEDEVTVKTFEIKNKKVRLLPANEKYQPIDVTGRKEFSVVGKVVGVVRWLN
ncbi:MAG: transcriptional repressor LexA [Ignavibacteriaceae bacterium]|nr:transcriptional repressor LexA [Ignavibacteriaceae bacterium]